MMHHPNMHHQPMSGHPPQHLPGHQGMPGHHQIPPHQMHRENRHVPMPRVAMGPSAGGAMAGHAQAMVGSVHQHQHPGPRPQHTIRPMHHPPAPHHGPPQQMKPMRRSYGAGFPPSVVYQQPPPPPMQPPQHPQHTPRLTQPGRPPIVQAEKPAPPAAASSATTASSATVSTTATVAAAASPPSEESPPSPLPQPAALANSKEKTPMCLVNELARYNKTKHQYRLTSETGPAHKKIFTVTLRLGDNEEYTAEGSSIKRAQHAAASAALSQTRLSAPPPRAHSQHAPAAHHRHTGSVMPTVELNALAMKLCQPAVYSSATGITAPPRFPRGRGAYRLHTPYLHAYPHPHPHPHAHPQRVCAPGIMYRSSVTVGARTWTGTGATPQGARHDAAARALQDLRPGPTDAVHQEDVAPDDDTANVSAENGTDILNSEVKSPVSLIHELALKRNLTVVFAVKSERGPPHMRVFITTCTVGDMTTEGEGNGKKVSKRRAAEKMLEEMRRKWPPALLRARPPPPPQTKRKLMPAKKKPRNLIKESGETPVESSAAASDNPISRLAMARHALRARSPQYCVVEERGAARRREFLVQCCAPPHRATGAGPNKKTAKRRAAVNVLLAMEMSGNTAENSSSTNNPDATSPSTSNDCNKSNSSDTKRKESELSPNGEVRQPVPGVLMMDYHPRAGQPTTPTNGLSESSATGGAGAATPGAKDQLMYLSQLLGFTVQFSDFPKRNHGSYLSLVSLSTEPPVMCHGGGASTQQSHEQCSRAALLALASMGLDAPPSAATAAPTTPPAADMASLPSAGAAKPNVLSNGIAE